MHLRFGTVSIRAAGARGACSARQAGSRGAEVWLSRADLARLLPPDPAPPPARRRRMPSSPHTTRIDWDHGKHADALFAAWCEGRTGYPLVDAAMQQINQTGYMHNRLRMVVASFLTKDLGLDWRRGEAYFALHLNDFDLAANNGGWQWAASSGCDAQPYFRIFNPVTQSERFDPRGPLHPPLPAAAGRAAGRADPCALAGAAGGPGGGRRRARPRLPGAGGRPRRGARAHLAALRRGQGGRLSRRRPATISSGSRRCACSDQ